jgi:predicted nucleic acid-binding protein
VRELCTQYGDWPLGFVDAAVVALAERERQTRIATLDRRHFGAIKPRHIAAFELLP